MALCLDFQVVCLLTILAHHGPRVLPLCQLVQDPKQIDTGKEVPPAKLVIVTCLLQGESENSYNPHSCRGSAVAKARMPLSELPGLPLLSPGGLLSQSLAGVWKLPRNFLQDTWSMWILETVPLAPTPGALAPTSELYPTEIQRGRGTQPGQGSSGSTAPEDHAPDQLFPTSTSFPSASSLLWPFYALSVL